MSAITLNYSTVDEARKAFWIASVGAVEKSAAAGLWQVTAQDGTVIKFRVCSTSPACPPDCGVTHG